MRQSIIIYTNYFIDGVMDILESVSMTVAFRITNSYSEFKRLIMEAPNILGGLCIEYRPTKASIKFYKDIVRVIDRIANSQERSISLSILYRDSSIEKIIDKTTSTAITIHMYKYGVMTDDLIRLEGIAPILVYSTGVFRKSATREFELSAASKDLIQRDSMIQAILCLMDETPNLDLLNVYFLKHPDLRKVYALKKNDDYWEELQIKYERQTMLVFCEVLRSERDNKADSNST